MNSRIPYARQQINQDDIDAVIEVLKSEYLTQGPRVVQFEERLAAYCQAKYAVATNSATSALHIACLALGLGPGDELWTSAITFVASANCGLYCGATVDFVDIDAGTYNMSPAKLEEKLIKARANGRSPKVVVAVHMCGQSCDMASIQALARKYNFKVIEDASHAIGGKYQHNPIGSCRYSDITVFSFHPVKIITTGEGGMAITNDLSLAVRMRALRSHGITRDSASMTKEPDGPWYYQQIELGYNYRITEIQAALGISQLARIDNFVQRRNELASRYNCLLSRLPIRLPKTHPYTYSAFHLYIVRVNYEHIKMTHTQIFDYLHREGVEVNLHYIPIYRHPYYERLGLSIDNCPEAESYYREAISLPMYASLTFEQQDAVVNVLNSALSK